MAEQEAKHNWRWRFENGRVSWTYRRLEDATASRPGLPATLERSLDNGETWEAADA